MELIAMKKYKNSIFYFDGNNTLYKLKYEKYNIE